MTPRLVFGSFGLLAFFAAPLFSQEMTEGPIGTVKREVYIKSTVRNKAPWVWTYTGEPGYREEIHTIWSHDDQVRGFGDSPTKPHRRVSHDDGKTWSELTPLPPILTLGKKISIIDWKFCGIYDPASKRHVDLSIHHVRDMRQAPPRRIYNHALIRLSSDGGKTFGPPEMLRYEEGENLSPETVLHPEFLKNNIGYPGQSIFRHSNGSLIIPVTNTKIPADVGTNPSVEQCGPRRAESGAVATSGDGIKRPKPTTGKRGRQSGFHGTMRSMACWKPTLPSSAMAAY